MIYEEPLEPTIFVQPENPTSQFNPTAQEQAPFTGAPPFAPGGPLNPYPASAGMAPPAASMPPGFEVPTNVPGQPGFDPELFESELKELQQQKFQVPQGPGLSAVGGYGAADLPANVRMPPPVTSRQTQGRLPGRVPGPFQPGGGQPKMPQQPMQPPPPQRMQQPMNPMPIPQPPPIQPPPTGQQTGAKPRGFRTLPMPERHHPPTDPPQPPGQWVTVDAGRGQPPAYGFLAQSQEVEAGVDTGLEGRPSHTGGARSGEYGSTSKASGAKSGEKGHYVPILLSAASSAEVEMEPAWVWIPEIDAEYGVRKRDDDDRPKVNPLGK